MIYDKQQITSFLPHRDPFLFVDSVEKCEIDGQPIEEGKVFSTKELTGISLTAKFFVREGFNP